MKTNIAIKDIPKLIKYIRQSMEYMNHNKNYWNMIVIPITHEGINTSNYFSSFLTQIIHIFQENNIWYKIDDFLQSLRAYYVFEKNKHIYCYITIRRYLNKNKIYGLIDFTNDTIIDKYKNGQVNKLYRIYEIQ